MRSSDWSGDGRGEGSAQVSGRLGATEYRAEVSRKKITRPRWEQIPCAPADSKDREVVRNQAGDNAAQGEAKPGRRSGHLGEESWGEPTYRYFAAGARD